MTKTPDPINIIGGGIGGLTFANALQHSGIDFRLFEQAAQLTEVGAAIGISKAALDILKILGLYSQVKNEGFEFEKINFSDKNLKVIRTITTEFPTVIIHRAKLINILASQLPMEKISLSEKLVDIKNEPNFSTLKFSSGSEIKSSCTVIADGIHSASRKQLFPQIKLRYAKQTIWRGITTMNLPEEHSGAYTEMWSGGKRFLFGPMDSKNFTWLAVKNQEVGGQDNPQTIQQELIDDYRDFHPIVKELLLNSANYIRTDIADLGTQKRKWFQDKIVFIGDAIHATTPNLAQGGCQAIEDAYCLSLLMGSSKDNFANIFPAYQRLRSEKVSFVINTSWNFGKIAHHKFLAQLGKHFLKYAPESAFRKSERKLNDLTYLPAR